MEKMITLVAADLDGTFLHSNDEISNLNKKAVRRLKKQGILFGLVSDRPAETVLSRLEEWKIDDSVSFILGANGGVLYDMRTGQKEEYHPLKTDTVLHILDFFNELDVSFLCYEGKTRYTNKSTFRTRQHAALCKEDEVQADLHALVQTKRFNKLSVYAEPNFMPTILERARQFHDEGAHGYLSRTNLFEFCDPAIHKAFGMKKLCEHFGIRMENILAFGDASNDIGMLKTVGTGVCVANATDDVKEAADVVSELTGDEDAVGRYLFDCILEESI